MPKQQQILSLIARKASLDNVLVWLPYKRLQNVI